MKSFMKWCGGKQRLVSQLLSHVPETYGTYFEPFIGAGSLYLALKPSKAYIGDLNEELIETYKGIQRDPQKVVDLLKSYPNDKEAFLKIRDASYSSSEERAARMLYVNRAGFNGLYRVNKKGKEDRWTYWYPLYHAGATKKTVMDFWNSQDFDLNLYGPNGVTAKGNCDGCFLKSEATLAMMWREHPDRMQWWADMEAKVGGTFHKSRSYADLGDFVDRQGDWIFDDEAFLCQADDGECTG